MNVIKMGWQTKIENKIKELEKRIDKLEGKDIKKPLLMKVEKNEIKGIEEIPQENYKQSVTKKGLSNTKEGVVTTESGDDKSPVDTKNKSQEVKK